MRTAMKCHGARCFTPGATHHGRERGLTLLEVLVAFSLFGVVTLSAFAVFNASFKAMLAGRGLADEHQNSRLALEWMTRRLRLAGLGLAPGTAFTEATATSVAFQYDPDRDGSPEIHRLCWDSTDGVIREEVGSVSAGCGSGVGAPISSRGLRPVSIVLLDFRYFQGTDVELPRPLDLSERGQVRRVRITLGMDSNRSGSYEPELDLILTMDAVLRNE